MQKEHLTLSPRWRATNFLDKNVNKLDIEGRDIDIIKAIYNKPTVIILKSKRLKVSPPGSGTR